MRTYLNTLVPIFILALSFILSSSNLNAQEVRLGLSMTPNVSWLKSTDGFHTTDGVNGNFGYALIIDFVQNKQKDPEISSLNAPFIPHLFRHVAGS